MNEMIIQSGDDCSLAGCALGCAIFCKLTPLIAIGVSAYDRFSD